MRKKNLTHKSSTFKPNLIVLLIPIISGMVVFGLIFTGRYQQRVSQTGANRLETDGWQLAQDQFKAAMPEYGRKYAYYKVKERQDITAVASHFGVPVETLARLNPGTIVAGTTVKITPLESPMKPLETTNGLLAQSRIIVENNIVHVKQDFKNSKITTNLPELVSLLAGYGVFEQTGPKSYRLMKSLSIEDNIRLDITNQTVDTLELNSPPGQSVCLCSENAELLIKGIKITSYDPATKGPDKNPADERSFIRALKSARMDILNSDISYLGNGLHTSSAPIQREGGTYGVSWRIPDDMLGVDIVTGWIENNQFHNNYFGSYTYGASGMVWQQNRFSFNEVYGLDPHDDSNNALIENNTFDHNGKHGFIVSKRCNYNVINNNKSYSNGLHGFMLHQDSSYNIFENNLAYDNTDNFAIYASDYNAVRNNRSYNPKGSHLRINEQTNNTFVTGNVFGGGGHGVYIYGDSTNTYVADNIFRKTKDIVITNGARNVFVSTNIIDRLAYKLKDGDRIIFGPNIVQRNSLDLPDGVDVLRSLSSSKTDESDQE